MSFWKDLGMSTNNSSVHKCFLHGYLQVMEADAIVENKFRYKIISEDNYTEESSAGMSADIHKHTKTIFTNFFWLPFTRGAKVKFDNGEELTISALRNTYDDNKAQGDGSGVTGVEITF